VISTRAEADQVVGIDRLASLTPQMILKQFTVVVQQRGGLVAFYSRPSSRRNGVAVLDTFDQFAADRIDRLLRFATALTCDPHLAQDVVQEVLVRVQAKWARIAPMQGRDQYVRRMIINEYLSWRRRKAARTVAATHSTLDALGTPTADPATGYAERDAMRMHVARLPRRQRAALMLRYYEDRTDAEIAELLGCSTGTVRSHISRALSTLRAAHQHPVREALS
jgi:RNA polymerase sigma-70 factor (sigma-E family)